LESVQKVFRFDDAVRLATLPEGRQATTPEDPMLTSLARSIRVSPALPSQRLQLAVTPRALALATRIVAAHARATWTHLHRAA
jgi:hypothetical protein